VNLTDDFAFGHVFAAADHAPIRRICRAERLALGMAHGPESRSRGTDWIPALLFDQFLASILKQVHHHLRDSRCSRQSRGLDAAQVHQALNRLGDFDHKIVPVINCGVLRARVPHRTQPCECADHRAQSDRGDQFARALGDFFQTIPCAGSILFVIDNIGIGTDNGIAVDGIGHQDALSLFRRDGEVNVSGANVGTVKDEIFTPPRLDDKFRTDSGFVHDRIGINASSVDDPAGKEITAVGAHADHPAAFHQKVEEFGLEQHLSTVEDGILRCGNGHLEGVANAACACP